MDAKKSCNLKMFVGIFLALISSLLYSIVTMIAKILCGPEYEYHPYSSSFWRFLGILVPSITLLVHYQWGFGKKFHKENGEKLSLFNTVWPLTDSTKRWATIGVMARGLSGGTSIILRYFALKYLTLADTSVIISSGPVLVLIMAYLFLQEKFGLVTLVSIILALCGVVIISRPPFLTGTEALDTNTLIGTTFAIGSLICSSLVPILTRKFRNVHYSVILVGAEMICVAEAFALTQIFGELRIPSGIVEISLVTTMGLFAFLGTALMTIAIQVEQAGLVTLMRPSEVIFGFIFQFIFLGVSPDLMSWIGGAVILFSVIIVGLRKWISTLPEDGKQRKRFGFVLA